MKKERRFVGLDVHAKEITVALAEGARKASVHAAGGDQSQPRIHGAIPNDLHAVEKLFARLRKAQPEAELRGCYEAGPTGFVLARRCAQLGIDCTVVAPSLIPIRAGERIMTDRRDARKLARLHRAGELKMSQEIDPAPMWKRSSTRRTCAGPGNKCAPTVVPLASTG